MTHGHRGNRARFKQLADGTFALGAVALALFAIGLLCITAGVWGFATRGDGFPMHDTNSAASLDETGRWPGNEVGRVAPSAPTSAQHLAGEASQARTKQSAGMIAAGMLFLLFAALIQVHGIAPLRRNSRSLAAVAAVVECSDDAVISETLDGRILSWNPAAARMYGYRAKEVIGKTLAHLQVPETADDADQVRNAVGQGPHFRYFEMDFIRNDGQQIAVSLSVSPIKDAAGNVIGVSKIARDVTGRKKIEDDNKCLALERDRLLRRLQLQIERMPLAYILFDAEFCVIDWNPAAEIIFGYRREEALGMKPPFEQLVPPSFRQSSEGIARRIQSGDMSAHSVNDNLTKDGRTITCEWFNTPLLSDDGGFGGLFCLARDITDRKRMEEELAKRNEQLRQSHKLEAVGSLAGGISHEFNNLLQVIRGYGQYAMQGLPPEDQRRQDLEQVVKAADRAAALTRQLLGFSRLQLLERVSFDHQEVVRDLVKLLRPLIGEHIELDVHLASDVGPIHADRGLVQQMLLNLCINARDSMPSGGRLTLKSECVDLSAKYCKFHPDSKPGSYVVFSVADTGCGMSAEVRERIFEPFFTTKGVGKGTGLGLAMVYGCVQQHGGMINVYSEVGLGTTFKIYLPITSGVDSRGPQESAVAPDGGHETILIAEDEPMVRELAVRILTSAGYSVLTAADGAEAVEVFEANADAISLTLLDAIMPKMTGHQAYDRIKLVNPDVPAIFCSGYDPETGQIKSLMDKGCRLVQKPYDPDVLLKVVREVLDQSHAQVPLCSA